VEGKWKNAKEPPGMAMFEAMAWKKKQKVRAPA
jgi:hypothetical protein